MARTASALKRIECDPDCGFAIQSHDESEVIDVARKHSKNSHNKDASNDELRKAMMTV